MNLQKTKKSGKIETKWWYSKNLETYLLVLLSNRLVPGCCTFSRLRNLLPKPFSVHQSSPSLYVFQVPLFSASLPCLSSRRCSHAPPLFSLLLSFSPFFVLYSYQPLKLNLLQRILLSFLLFPFLFQKSECSSPLMQDLLFPYACSHINSFFLTKYFSYLF